MLNSIVSRLYQKAAALNSANRRATSCEKMARTCTIFTAGAAAGSTRAKWHSQAAVWRSVMILPASSTSEQQAECSKRRTTITQDPRALQKRVDGDTYVCPNAPYFFVVESSTATQEDIGNRNETIMRNDFMSSWNAEYQNRPGQTEVSSFTPYDGENIEDVTIALEMDQGTISYISPPEMESLTEDLFVFRNQQRWPIGFVVGIYTGLPDRPGAGLNGHSRFLGD